MDSAKKSQPLLGNVRSSTAFVHTVVNLAVFTDAYLYTLVIPVLPFALVERLRLDEADVQRWIGILLAAYGAGLLLGSPIVAYFADRTKTRQGPYLWGLIALAASTVAISLGQSKWVLLVGRLVQGGSSAIVHTVGMAILADSVGEEGVGPAMGFIGMTIALGALTGPVIGGLLYHNYGYLAVFLSGYALVALDFLLRIILILPSPNKAIVEAGATYGTCSSSQENAPDGSSDSTTDPPPNPKETPNPPRHPLLTLLTTSRMLAAILAETTHGSMLSALETTLPLHIKNLFAYNSSQISLFFLVLNIPSFFAPLVGHISDRTGAKIIITLGLLILSPCLILLRLIDHPDNIGAQVALLCCLLLCIGVAMNMTSVPAFADAMYVVDDLSVAKPGIFGPQGAYAQSAGLMTVAYAVGGLVGPSVGGLLAERVGWDGMTLVAGIVCAVCALPCLYYTGGRRVRKGVVREEGLGE